MGVGGGDSKISISKVYHNIARSQTPWVTDFPRCTKIPKIDLPNCAKIPRFINTYLTRCKKNPRIAKNILKILGFIWSAILSKVYKDFKDFADWMIPGGSWMGCGEY